jgi:hypothetical protein
MHQPTQLVRLILTLPAIVFSLQACTVPITLKTRPPGATVVANGEILGTTPLEIDPDELFPARFKGYQWEREGTLRFERVGCQPQNLPINNDSVKRSVRIDLDCEPGAAAMVNRPPTAESVPVPKASALERLEELNLMKQRGLISEEEFQLLRQRVIDRF